MSTGGPAPVWSGAPRRRFPRPRTLDSGWPMEVGINGANRPRRIRARVGDGRQSSFVPRGLPLPRWGAARSSDAAARKAVPGPSGVNAGSTDPTALSRTLGTPSARENRLAKPISRLSRTGPHSPGGT